MATPDLSRPNLSQTVQRVELPALWRAYLQEFLGALWHLLQNDRLPPEELQRRLFRALEALKGRP